MVLRTDWRGGEKKDAGCGALLLVWLPVGMTSQGFDAFGDNVLEKFVPAGCFHPCLQRSPNDGWVKV